MAANPFETLQMIAGGYCLSRCLHVIADLGVADKLDNAPKSVADLATEVGANEDALTRMLTLLATYGIFEKNSGGFSHSAASRLLRTDHPQSMRGFARMFGLPINWSTYMDLEYTARTGRPAADKASPGGLWAHYQNNPEASRIFNDAMVAKAHGQVAAVAASYDFSRFRTIADIGGGRGHLIEEVLDWVPSAKGVLFDLPHVIADASALASDRLSLQGGDFFKDPLPAADAYVLMEIIHDWVDAESIAILKAVRRAANPRATVLLIESIVPEGSEPHWSRLLDIHMMTLLGGRQRTKTEYANLLSQAGFKFDRVIDTRGDVSIVEAKAV